MKTTAALVLSLSLAGSILVAQKNRSYHSCRRISPACLVERSQ